MNKSVLHITVYNIKLYYTFKSYFDITWIEPIEFLAIKTSIGVRVRTTTSVTTPHIWDMNESFSFPAVN